MIWLRIGKIEGGVLVDTVWTQYGHSVDTVWTQCGHSMDTVWTQCRAFEFHKMWGNFLTGSRSVGFSRRTLLRGESLLAFKALMKASLNNQTALHSLVRVHSSATNSIGLCKGELPMSPACFNLKLPSVKFEEAASSIPHLTFYLDP